MQTAFGVAMKSSVSASGGATAELSKFIPNGTYAPDRSTFFVGVAKSGSTLMHMIVEDICSRRDLKLLNISDTCFRSGIPERKIPAEIMPGVVDATLAYFYGFRCIGNLIKCRSFREGTKIFLIRDPRDALTSLYFSMQKSHSLPKAGLTADIISSQRTKAESQSIDDFIIGGSGDFIITALNEILDMSWLPNFHLYRYEDVIFRKRQWIEDFSELAAMPVDESLMSEILGKHDVFPDVENPSRHIRQVAPGNFREHLSERSVGHIQLKSRRFLAAFGYA